MRRPQPPTALLLERCLFLGVLLLTQAPASAQEPADPAGVGWDGMPVFVWRLAQAGRPIPEELVLAFGGVNVEGAREEDWARERGLDFYVGHAPGRNELHIDSDRPWYADLWQEYWDERQPRALLRVPCLSETSTHEALAAKLEASLSARDGDCGLGISLGDEVGLTPWGGPLDLCESTACREGFASFLRASSRWKLPPTSPENALPYPDTDTTRVAWLEGDASHVQAWLARRDYHHRVVHDALEALATRARELQPGVPIGLFGQSGRTAFGDVGIERVLEFVDFLEVYRILDGRELLYTMRDEQQRSLLTLFHDPEAPHGATWLAWEHWLRGGDGFVLWSDRDLEQHRPYLAGMRRAVSQLRDLRQRLPDWRPRPSGVAVIHAPDSLALSWLRDALHDGPTWMRRFASYQNQHGTREVSLRALLRLIEDCGWLPGAVPIDQVDGHTVEQFPVLVANHLILLGDEQREGLKRYIKGGGRLVLVGDFDLYGRDGTRRELSGRQSFSPSEQLRVHSLAWDPPRYAEERWPAPQAREFTTRQRQAFAQLASAASPGRIQWSLKAEGFPGPWLTASQEEASGESWLCAALPNAESAEERRQLVDLELSLQVPEGVHLELLHPKSSLESLRLPAGEALVFRVTVP